MMSFKEESNSLAKEPSNLNDPLDCWRQTTFINFSSSDDPLTTFFSVFLGADSGFSSLDSDSPSMETDSSESLAKDEEDSDDITRLDDDALSDTVDEAILARTDEDELWNTADGGFIVRILGVWTGTFLDLIINGPFWKKKTFLVYWRVKIWKN